jgi:hypothetical protein
VPVSAPMEGDDADDAQQHGRTRAAFTTLKSPARLVSQNHFLNNYQLIL